jgi:hypothetical protein
MAALSIWLLRSTTHFSRIFVHCPSCSDCYGLLAALIVYATRANAGKIDGGWRKGEVFRVLVWRPDDHSDLGFFNIGVLIALLLPLAETLPLAVVDIKDRSDTVYPIT